MLRRLLVVVVLLAGAAAAGGWWLRGRLTTPYRAFAGAEQFVDVPQGASVGRIASLLADAGVVPDPITFRIAARLSGADRRLQAGEYRFADAASPYDVVARLARGDVFSRVVTFPEGLTIADMAATFAGAGLGTAAEFEQAAANPSAIGDLDPTARSLEGYLFPDTYSMPRRAGAVMTVAAMVDRFRAVVDGGVRRAATARGMSLRDVVTLASLVEKETASADERPLVSAVYHNRLRIGMPLQCDPTVIYALMQRGAWRGNLTRANLQMDSPYNTYRYPGLPPGPIASPGRSALEAAVEPADVPYLYFVSRNDGTHAFASSLAEHSRNVRTWQVNYFKGQRAKGRGQR
ncbi:MAG: endolytic transglycosylase MltG [Acidobacteria bacterium]|nr:endolytic transglycosylase MltG [Acidobacteriota bacterium]